jgi:hypothetical protein
MERPEDPLDFLYDDLLWHNEPEPLPENPELRARVYESWFGGTLDQHRALVRMGLV